MIWKASTERVRCPYCKIGGGLFTFQRAANADGFPIQFDLGNTVKCDTCKHPKTGLPNEFKVRPILGLQGVGLDFEYGKAPTLKRAAG